MGIDTDRMGRNRRSGDRYGQDGKGQIWTGWEGTGGMGIDMDRMGRDRKHWDRYGPDGK